MLFVLIKINRKNMLFEMHQYDIKKICHYNMAIFAVYYPQLFILRR